MNILEEKENVFESLLKLVKNAQDRIHSNLQSDFTREIIPFSLESKKKDSEEKINQYISSLYYEIKKAKFLSFFTEFESEIFKKFDIASKNAEIAIDNGLQSTSPYYENRKNLIVRSKNFNGIGSLKNQIILNLNKKDEKYLTGMIKYRDHLVHGMRVFDDNAEAFQRNLDFNELSLFINHFIKSL
jgi:hypothetical protein